MEELNRSLKTPLAAGQIVSIGFADYSERCTVKSTETIDSARRRFPAASLIDQVLQAIEASHPEATVAWLTLPRSASIAMKLGFEHIGFPLCVFKQPSGEKKALDLLYREINFAVVQSSPRNN